MKVLVKNFEQKTKTGNEAQEDDKFLLRQHKIMEMYQMLIGLFRLTTARK
jgi:hypothetical protein